MVSRWTNAFKQFHLFASPLISQCAKQRVPSRSNAIRDAYRSFDTRLIAVVLGPRQKSLVAPSVECVNAPPGGYHDLSPITTNLIA